MKKLLSFLIVICCALAVYAQKKQDLKILYVGGSSNYDTFSSRPDSLLLVKSVKERMASFEKMLKRYFKTVKVVEGKDYRQKMSDDYDVTVFDGLFPAIRQKSYLYDDNGQVKDVISPIYFTDDFDRPAITIAELGEDLGRSLGIKSDWYCLCLDADAHSWVKDHPIFKGPFPVKLNVSLQPTPAAAKEYAKISAEVLPDSILMWKVQNKGYATDKGFRVGMVSRPNGYGDPDDEVISSGVCAKSIDAVALARHANFFHWGFSASPADMTPEGRQVFANAIVYISKFAGQRPVARKLDERITTRDKNLVKGMKYTLSRKCWEEYCKTNDEYNQQMEEMKKETLAKKAKGEKLNQIEEISLIYQPMKNPSYAMFLKQREPEMYHFFGEETGLYVRYYEINYPYFYGQGFNLAVDEDARELGIPNNDKRLLDTAIRMLEEGKDVEKATRILHHYTLCRFETPAEWRKWYDAYQDKLFFSEGGGFLWLVNTQDKTVPGNDYHVLDTVNVVKVESPSVVKNETDDNNPVLIEGKLNMLENGKQELAIRIKIHPGYHIYAKISDKDPYIPTTFDFQLPEGWKQEGEMQLPSFTQLDDNGTTVYTGECVFRQTFEGKGSGEIKCVIRYQCCNNTICLPPVEKELSFSVK